MVIIVNASAIAAAVVVRTFSPSKLVAEITGSDDDNEHDTAVNAAVPATIVIGLGPFHEVRGVKIVNVVTDLHIPLFAGGESALPDQGITHLPVGVVVSWSGRIIPDEFVVFDCDMVKPAGGEIKKWLVRLIGVAAH